MSVAKKMFTSILSSDWYILVCACIALVVFVSCKRRAKEIQKRISLWRKDRNPDFASYLDEKLNKWYNVFLTLITVFPLLGMFGTVKALLGLNISGSDLANIQNQFFDALTSTAWGIIFAIGFKLLNAFNESFIDEQIKEVKKVTKELEYFWELGESLEENE